MWSSPMLLSLSTVFALVGLALVLVAGFSDNWLEYEVNRSKIYDASSNEKLSLKIKDSILKDQLYFSRTQGLIHICFPDSVPTGIGSFSKFGSSCIFNVDYFPKDEAYDRYNNVQKQRLWMMRTQIIAYVIGVSMILICLVVGIVGCYKRSAKVTRITAFILIFAVLFLAVSLALWHVVFYQERHLLIIYPFYSAWDAFLKNATHVNFGYSYIVFWIGLAFCLFAAIFLLLSGRAIQYEEDRIYESKHAAYYQQYYDKSLVPVSYGAPYAGNAYGMYTAQPPPPPAAYYGGHPAYGASNYYGYMSYGA